MDYLSSLNEEQKKAVTFNGKHALVIAGAGTGKTRTIIHRAVYLLSQGVRPDKILILSFTRKSAREIVERIKQFQNTGSALNLSGQTFHSWCSHIIKNNPQVFEQYDYTLLDSEDVDSLFKLLFTQKYKNNKTVDQKLYSKIQSVYSYMLNTRKPLIETIKIQECSNMSEDEKEEYIKHNEPVFKEIMRDYIAYKKKNKLFDYDDLLYITANGLQQNKEAGKFISSKYEHILVDEFQDTNPLQYQLLESFYDNCHLFCVGDDAQSIYAFRGADFKSMHNFTDIVPNSTKLYLNINYRSTQEILDISNWLLEQSHIKYDKHLKAYRGTGIKPVIEYMYDEYSEANSVTDKILLYFMNKNIDYSGHIVLSRTLSGLRQVEGACVMKKIPYKIYGGSSLMKSRHIRDVVAAMRIIANYKDSLAWHRYLQLWNKIGPATAVSLSEYMVNAENLEQALYILKTKKIDKRVWEVLEAAFPYISSPAEMINEILDLMDLRFAEIYKEEWLNWRKQDFAVLEEIASSTTSVTEFITEYILDPALESTFLDADKPKECVILSTIHSAKGLEADVCHLLNVTPYSYPSKRAVKEGDNSIEEERRCLYVALTRAKNELILYSRYFTNIGSGMADFTGQSHYFFNELPEELYELNGSLSQKDRENAVYNGSKISVDIDLF
ncbi:MAG: ATP-dependent helicase [Mucispirillum sp.]|nr:ATP-dependent helicase [Mucispirillum sp.]